MHLLGHKQLRKTIGILFLFLLISLRVEAIEDFAKYKSVLLQQSITGIVSSEDGMPLAGVSVFEKGTNNGTITDFDGNYTIEITGSDATLVFSYIGFTTQEVLVNDQSEINISLKEDLSQLDEVVVVGFGTQKKVNLTGAVATVDEETFQSRPTFLRKR